MAENNYDLDYTGSMVDRILDTGYDLQNQGYIFRGLSSHYSGTPTERIWLIAPTGSTGFGLSSPVPPGSIGICMYNGSSWSAEVLNTLTLDTAPTTGSGNGITSGAVKTLAESITNAIGQLEQSVSDRFTSMELEDTTGSLQAEVLSITLKYVFEGETESLTSLSILAATAEKAGLMSAADKQKLDAFVTNIRSLRIQDTTVQTDQGTEITNTLRWTIEGVTEAITAFTLYAATTSKAGLMSAADKTALDTLPSLINAGYLYAGIATPATVPSSTDAKIFYIAIEGGTYTNFGNLNVTQGINIIYKSGNAWSVAQVVGIDNEPTAGSDNLVKSGGVAKFNQLNFGETKVNTMEVTSTGWYDLINNVLIKSGEKYVVTISGTYEWTRALIYINGHSTLVLDNITKRKYYFTANVDITSISVRIVSGSGTGTVWLSVEYKGTVTKKIAEIASLIGYYTCVSAANAAAKTIGLGNAPDYSLENGGSIKIKFTNANTASSVTLKFGEQDAKPLYYNGEPVSALNTWKDGDVVEVFYDGTNYNACPLTIDGAQYKGIALPGTGAGYQKRKNDTYIAPYAGIYNRLVQNIELNNGEIAIVKYDGSNWVTNKFKTSIPSNTFDIQRFSGDIEYEGGVSDNRFVLVDGLNIRKGDTFKVKLGGTAVWSRAIICANYDYATYIKDNAVKGEEYTFTAATDISSINLFMVNLTSDGTVNAVVTPVSLIPNFKFESFRTVYLNRTGFVGVPQMHIGKNCHLAAHITNNAATILFGLGFTDVSPIYRSNLAMWFEITNNTVTCYRIGYVGQGGTTPETIVQRPYSIIDYSEVTLSLDVDNTTDEKWVFRMIDKNGNLFTIDSDTVETEAQMGKRWTGSGTPFVYVTDADVEMSFMPKDLINKIWIFGDSYTHPIVQEKWTYHLMQWGFDSFLLNSLSGMDGNTGIDDLRNLLKSGYTPSYVLWELGINGSGTEELVDGHYVIDATHKAQIDTVIKICRQKNITPVFFTIPTIHTIQKDGYTAYVRSLGYRYIDIYQAVGAQTNGDWNDRLMGYDGVHPNVYGAEVIAMRVLADFPEITKTL